MWNKLMKQTHLKSIPIAILGLQFTGVQPEPWKNPKPTNQQSKNKTQKPPSSLDPIATAGSSDRVPPRSYMNQEKSL